MGTNSQLMLIEAISQRTEYIVARVDDLYDTVNTGFGNMRTKAECEECKSRWVPRSWATPVVILTGFLVAAAGFAGDLLKVASWFGIQR